MQEIVKNDDLNYKSKCAKTYDFRKYSLPIVFSSYIHEGYLSLENADLKQSNFTIESKNFEKVQKRSKKGIFYLGLPFSGREKVLNSFKSRLFPIKNLDKIPTCQPTPEPDAEATPEVATEPIPKPPAGATPTKHKKSKLKLQQEFMNKIIDEEKDINNKIFLNYFIYHNPLFLVKDLVSTKQDKIEKTVNNISDALIDLRRNINRKEIPENENPEKLVDIVEKILILNSILIINKKVTDRKTIKLLTSKQMLQRLQIAQLLHW